MTVSAVLATYNEENRIDDALKSLMWCDEIVILDKYSTDDTVLKAKKYGDKVKIVYFPDSGTYDSLECNVSLNECTSEWVFFFTASDVIHPALVEKIKVIIKDNGNEFDIIHIPFRRYVLGLDFLNSPWHSDLSPKIVKKSCILINQAEVHDALTFKGRNFYMKKNQKYCMYHLTHETVDIMMDRHLRYWRGEANGKKIDLKESIKTIFKSAFKLIFFKRLPLSGYDGFMILFSYLTYQMMSYVYKWEKKRGNATITYSNIKSSISLEWDKYET